MDTESEVVALVYEWCLRTSGSGACPGQLPAFHQASRQGCFVSSKFKGLYRVEF